MGKSLCRPNLEGMKPRQNSTPIRDGADTSSFTLSRQRENIAAVEVGWDGLLLCVQKPEQTEVYPTAVAGRRSLLRRHATIQVDLPRRLSSRAGRRVRPAWKENQ